MRVADTSTRILAWRQPHQAAWPTPAFVLARGEHAVLVGGAEAEDDALVVDHGPAVVVPVVVLAGEGPVEVDELVDGGVVGGGGDGGEVGVALEHDVRPEVAGGDVQR